MPDPDRPRPALIARRALSVVLAGVGLAAGCSSDREAAPEAFPGATRTTDGLVPGTVAPGYAPYVEGLAANFVDGGRLVARLDEPRAACVAERWVSILDPAALQSADIEAARMRDVTLEDLAGAVTIDEQRAAALTESFGAGGADHTVAFLDSLLLTEQITPAQRVCLGEVMPDGLISAITVSVLSQDELDDELSAQYGRALDGCA